MPRGHVLPDGDRIAGLRGEADLTQWQLASESGYGLRTIGKIEDGQPTGASTLSAVATVLARRLKRPVGLGDLIRRPEGEGTGCTTCGGHLPCVVRQGVKLLDLTGWLPASRNGQAVESRVVLDDQYHFRRVASSVRTLQFYYATPGPRMCGKSLTHPEEFQWQALERGETRSGGESHLNIAYRMRLKLEKGGEDIEVHNRLEYVNAFTDERREWFHTHVVLPTEALTIVALFPEEKRCRFARGVSKMHPAEPLDTTEEQPVVLSSGRLALWSLTAPQQGGTYQLEWQW